MPPGGGHVDYCCAGCKSVHALLRDEGLDRFYELGGGRGRPIGAAPAPSRRDWLEALEARGRRDDGTVAVEFDVQGIHCAACVWLLQELRRRIATDARMDLNPSTGRMRLGYAAGAGSASVAAFLDEIERLGYRTAPGGRHGRRHDRALLWRLGVSIALALNAMVFASSGYFGMTAADGVVYELFGWLSFGFATGALLVGGPVFIRAALGGLRRRVLHLDLPIALGILLAYGASVGDFVRSGGHSYFDTVTVFVALMLLGRYLQQRAVQRNRDYLLRNDGAEHVFARRVAGGSVDRVNVVEVQAGDVLLITPGDLVPVRARLVADVESTPFSLDWIDGEALPRRFEPGDVVPAGAFHHGARAVRVEALETAAQSGVLRALATPHGSSEDVRGRDRFWVWLNRVYVGLVLGIAAVAGLVWWFVDPASAIPVVTSVLVVTCPCALGLATPLGFEMALAGLRRAGVFVRTNALLEKARFVRKLVFDKTGTLTWGGVRVDELRPIPERWRDVALTMASSSSHPVSEALARRLREQGGVFRSDLAVTEDVGCGVEAVVDGHVFRVGSPLFVQNDAASQASENLCVFTRDGRVEGSYAIEEDYRAGMREELRDLAGSGYEIHLSSGDRDARVRRAGAVLQIPPDRVRGDMRPADKAAFVASIDDGDTMMIGDGLNDAPAFDAAFCAGTPAIDRPVMPERADFFYAGSGVGAVSRVLACARRFHRVVTVNLWLAGAYNAVALTACLLGRMTPLLAAVLMPLSSLVLIGHTSFAMRRAGGPT